MLVKRKRRRKKKKKNLPEKERKKTEWARCPSLFGSESNQFDSILK
jgi:hypothetical protein